MADLTNLESKLAEVLGLAEAAKGASEKVTGLLTDDQQALAGTLERMRDEEPKQLNAALRSPASSTARRRQSSRPLAKPSRRRPR